MPDVGTEVNQREQRQGQPLADLVEDDLIQIEQRCPAQTMAVELAADLQVLDPQCHQAQLLVHESPPCAGRRSPPARNATATTGRTLPDAALGRVFGSFDLFTN